jgi:hypothetical protein
MAYEFEPDQSWRYGNNAGNDTLDALFTQPFAIKRVALFPRRATCNAAQPLL